jgi:DNA-binding transcriptional ArsR family regulator
LTVGKVAWIVKYMLDQLDRTFAALADSGRRAMLSRLGRGPASVSELAEPLNMTLSAVLQHINYLEDTGLVTTQKHGRTRVVTAAPAGLEDAKAWIAAHEAAWHGRLDRLGAALDIITTQGEQP